MTKAVIGDAPISDKVAVVLSGCGFLDGAEIRESVLALLALSKAGAEVKIFAPDINQHHTINHFSGEETGEKRNVLVESARIARGQVQELSTSTKCLM
jgi:enhancing lycopene biosynthesis protein 2